MSIAKSGFADTNATVTSTSGADVVATLDMPNDSEGWLTFEVSNDGTALNAFSLEVQPHPAAGWHELLADAGFDTAGENAKWSTTNIHTCADEATEAAGVFVGPAHKVRFKAGVASSTTSVTVSGSVY